MSKFLAIISDSSQRNFAEDVALRLALPEKEIFEGGVAAAAKFILEKRVSAKYILIDIGFPNSDVFAELDALAQNCSVGTKVVVVGDVNDLNFYRELIKRGVVEYFVKPASVDDVVTALRARPQQAQASANANGKVISFISSSSGDGSTSVALNVAYMLATKHGAETVVVDMDYQFGLVARSLDLAFSTGIKDLYSQPDGMIDETFIEKTIVSYKNNLSIIPAPRELGIMPNISAETIINLIKILKSRYKFVIIDLPHVWSEWVAVVLSESDRNIMVSQLSLKSVTHANRLLEAFENNGINRNKISILINRSGSKLKEPFSASEYALVTKHKIDFYISNDSKTMAIAEDKGQTAVEAGNSLLNKQFEEIAKSLVGG